MSTKRTVDDAGGKLVRNAGHLVKGLGHAADIVGHVRDIVEHCATCAEEIEKQRTEQARISIESREQVERIMAQRDVLLGYLERSFDERKENFARLFERLDRALEKEDPASTRAVLDAIVGLAKSSPFEALKDVGSAKAALKDKNKVWEF